MASACGPKRLSVMAIDQSPLGRDTTYPSEYAPELLFPIARSLAREHLPTPLPVFYGVDIWTGYEVSWLDLSGKPRVAIRSSASLVTVPASSNPNPSSST